MWHVLAGIVCAVALVGCSSTAFTGAPGQSSSAAAPASSGAASPEPSEATSSAAVLQLADACPRIQDALDESFVGDGPTAATMREFASSITALVALTDPKGQNLLETLAEASRSSATQLASDDPFERLDALSPWLDEMDRVTDVCEGLGAPLK